MSRRCRASLVLIVIGGSAAVAAAASTEGSPLDDPKIEAFVGDPWAVLAKDGTPGGFRIVALSNLAEACTNAGLEVPARLDEARACADATATTALDARLSPYGVAVADVDDLGGYGMFLTHLSIVLAARERLVGDHRHQALQQRIAAHLAATTLADPWATMPSFPDASSRWPADQAAASYALVLHDRAYGTELAADVIAAHAAVMAAKGTDPDTGLPRSELTGAMPYGATPRGCALTWTVRYMSAWDPDGARHLWGRTREVMGVDLIAAYGFREYPPGRDHGADIDSGPIVFGIGAAATAFSIGASRAVGDDATYARLRASEAAGHAYALKSAPVADAADDLLATAITWEGRSVRPW